MMIDAIMRPIRSGYRMLNPYRPGFQEAGRHYLHARRFFERAAFWSDTEKNDWILERLRFVVRRAYDNTDYYREVLNGIGFNPYEPFGFDDFGSLPVLERSSVQDDSKRLMSGNVDLRTVQFDGTGGSTGVPVRFAKGPEEQGWLRACSEEQRLLWGVPPGSLRIKLWGHHLDPASSQSPKQRLLALLENQYVLEAYRLSARDLEDYHALLETRQPTVLGGYASSLYALAEHLDKTGVSPSYPTFCLTSAAEKLWPHQRELVETVFRRPIYEVYGSRDLGLIAAQVPGQSSLALRVNWANLLVEPEEEAGEHRSILVTKLHGDAMPMIRYRIGDMGRFTTSSRPGYPTLHIQEVTGRDVDRIVLQDGSWLNGVTLVGIMRTAPVKQFQVVQLEDLSLQIDVVPDAGYNDDQHYALLSVIRSNMGDLPVKMRIVEDVVRTKSNKWRPVVSHATL